MENRAGGVGWPARLATGLCMLLAVWDAAAAPRMAPLVEMSLGGYMEQSAGFATNAPGVRVTRQGGTSARIEQPNPFAQRADAEIWFQGRGRLSPTTTIGFMVQLEADSQGDRQIDESYLFLEGRFGRLLLGAENDAAYLQHVSAPRAGAAWGVLESAATSWVFKPRNVAFLSTTAPLTTGDDRKLTFFSPRLGGVQIGLSATPAAGESGRDLADAMRERTNLGTISANWRLQTAATRIAASAGFVHGGPAPRATAADRRAAIGDAGVGAELRYRSLALGAGFRRLSNPGGSNDGTAIAAGVAWDATPWAAGLGVLSSRTAGTANGGGTGDLGLVSGSYQVGPGVHATGAVFAARFARSGQGAAAEDRNAGFGVVSGLRLSF